MSQRVEVLVLGGGVIGLSIAYFLAKEGVEVGIVDQGEMGREASWAGAGMLPAGNPQRAGSALARLRAAGTTLFETFSQELHEKTGVDNEYVKCGAYELRLTEDDLEQFRFKQVLHEAAGEEIARDVLSRAELLEREPNLSDALSGGLFYKHAAQIRNPRHLQALNIACRMHGVKMFPGHPIVAMAMDGERITNVASPTESFTASSFVICCGAWSGSLLAQMGCPMRVVPVRGQMLLLRASAPLFHGLLTAGPRYMVSRRDGRILVGSTEEDAGFVKANTPQGIQELLSFAMNVVPKTSGLPVEKMWSGFRPRTTDGKPLLGRVPRLANAFAATGHFRSGLQLSGITGMLMKELILGQPGSMDLKPFRLDRMHDDCRTTCA